MSNERTPRELASREKTQRYVYVPPSNLPDPSPDPDWMYRWVATAILGQADPTNVSKRMREGWVPVKAEDHPELMLTMAGAPSSGNVEIGGLMLCKMPRKLAESREAYYQQQSQQQVQSVDNHFMRQSDARMPLFSEKKSEVSRGGGFGSGTK
jgi:hypothetical protein